MSTITVSPLFLSPTYSGGERCSNTLLETSTEMLKSLMECPANRKCFDCADFNSPRYVCFAQDAPTFVCSCCANIHKEFGHPIKCLNVFVLTASDLALLQHASNKTAADKWLAKWSQDIMVEPDPTSPTYNEDARKYIKAKYIEKRWCTDEPITSASEQGTSTVFTNAFLSPPLMCPYMPPAYTPMPFPPTQYEFQYSPSVDKSLFMPLPVAVPFQFVENSHLQQPAYCAPQESDHGVPISRPNSDSNQLDDDHSSSPIDFNRPLLTRSLAPQAHSPSRASPRSLSLSRSTTVVAGNSSPTQQSLHRSISDNAVSSPKRPDLRVSPLPANKNIDKSSIRHKFRVHTLVNKMANLLSPKKLNE